MKKTAVCIAAALVFAGVFYGCEPNPLREKEECVNPFVYYADRVYFEKYLNFLNGYVCGHLTKEEKKNFEESCRGELGLISSFREKIRNSREAEKAVLYRALKQRLGEFSEPGGQASLFKVGVKSLCGTAGVYQYREILPDAYGQYVYTYFVEDTAYVINAERLLAIADYRGAGGMLPAEQAEDKVIINADGYIAKLESFTMDKRKPFELLSVYDSFFRQKGMDEKAVLSEPATAYKMARRGCINYYVYESGAVYLEKYLIFLDRLIFNRDKIQQGDIRRISEYNELSEMRNYIGKIFKAYREREGENRLKKLYNKVYKLSIN